MWSLCLGQHIDVFHYFIIFNNQRYIFYRWQKYWNKYKCMFIRIIYMILQAVSTSSYIHIQKYNLKYVLCCIEHVWRSSYNKLSSNTNYKIYLFFLILFYYSWTICLTDTMSLWFCFRFLETCFSITVYVSHPSNEENLSFSNS